MPVQAAVGLGQSAWRVHTRSGHKKTHVRQLSEWRKHATQHHRKRTQDDAYHQPDDTHKLQMQPADGYLFYLLADILVRGFPL